MYNPVWNRSPNKFIRYESRTFGLPPNAYGIVKSGIETFAIFKDRHGKEQEMTAYITWDN